MDNGPDNHHRGSRLSGCNSQPVISRLNLILARNLVPFKRIWDVAVNVSLSPFATPSSANVTVRRMAAMEMGSADSEMAT